MKNPEAYLPRFSIDIGGSIRDARVPRSTTLSQPSAVRSFGDVPRTMTLGDDAATAGEDSMTREQLRLPISLEEVFTDQTLFESADGSTDFFLPRYNLAEQVVSGKPQFRVELAASGSGGSLIVYLAAYQPTVPGTQNRNVQPLDHQIVVLLRYHVPTGGGSTREELIFDEVTTSGNAVRAVLHVDSLPKFTQLSAVISDARYNTALIMRRTVHVAIPSPTTQPAMPVLSSGTLTIPIEAHADLDSGIVGDQGDLWWHSDNVQRRLSPQNGTQVADISMLEWAFDALPPHMLYGLGHDVTGYHPEPSYSSAELLVAGFSGPHAIMMVTPNWNPGGTGGIYNNHPIGVWFDSQNWQIYNQDIGVLSQGNAFNVEILVSGPSTFVHQATAANIRGNYSDIDHPLSNDNPNVLLIVTPNWNPGGTGGIYNNHPIGVWYNTSTRRWSIYNQDTQPLPPNAAFNVKVLASGPSTFVHRATAANIRGNYSNIDHPLSNDNPNALLMVTPNWNPSGTGGIYNNHAIGVWYNTSTRRWSIYNQDMQTLPANAAFNVEILAPSALAFVHYVEQAGSRLNHCSIVRAADAQGMALANHRFAIRTDAGNYAKVQIEDDSGPLTVRWITYQSPAWPFGTALFRTVSQTFEDELAPQPFAFSPTLQPYIFRDIGQQAGNKYGFVHCSAQWNGRSYSYYQDEARPHIFKYLPDSFKIARHSPKPYYPYMAVRIMEDDTAVDASTVTLDYRAAPFVDRARLESAAQSLRTKLPRGLEELVFEPLLPGPNSTRLLLKRPGTDVQEHNRAVVDLREGIDDSLRLSLGEFQEIFAMLCGEASFFNGWVEVTVGDMLERIPFVPRLNDLVGNLFEVEQRWDAAAGQLALTLRNAIESPLRIKELATIFRRIDFLVGAIIQQPTSPLELAAGASAEVLLTPPHQTGVPRALEAELNWDEVQVLLDPEAALQAILRIKGAQSTQRIDVRAPSMLFDVPVGAPDQQIVSIVIDFEHGDSVELRPDQLTAQAKVGWPIKDYLLERINTGEYRYWIKVYRHQSGQPTREERVDTTTKLIVTV